MKIIFKHMAFNGTVCKIKRTANCPQPQSPFITFNMHRCYRISQWELDKLYMTICNHLCRNKWSSHFARNGSSIYFTNKRESFDHEKVLSQMYNTTGLLNDYSTLAEKVTDLRRFIAYKTSCVQLKNIHDHMTRSCLRRMEAPLFTEKMESYGHANFI